MSYFILHNGEDGLSVELVSEKEVMERITLVDGTNYYGTDGFSSRLESDKFESGDTLIIIKGDIVIPKPKSVVKEWELP